MGMNGMGLLAPVTAIHNGIFARISSFDFEKLMSAAGVNCTNEIPHARNWTTTTWRKCVSCEACG